MEGVVTLRLCMCEKLVERLIDPEFTRCCHSCSTSYETSSEKLSL